ncbi:MAG: hypothetical protein Q9202_001098 [Teloschistes flavicans]
MSTLQHHLPEDRIRRSLSPHLPSVLGFTPIDPRLLSFVPFESSSISVPPANGVNSGRKRSRTLSALSPPVSKPKPPKKTKRLLVPRDKDVADRATKSQPSQRNTIGKEFPGDFETIISPQHVHSEDTSECKTLVKSSSSTLRQSPSTCADDLSLVYQTAFRHEDQPRTTGHKAKPPQTYYEADQGHLAMVDPLSLFCGQSSSTLGTVQADSVRASSIPDSIWEGIFDQSPLNPFCQVRCSPGVIPNSQLPYTADIGPSKGLPALKQCWPNPNSDVGQVGISNSKDSIPTNYKGKKIEDDVVASNHSHGESRPFLGGNGNVDFQVFDEFPESDFEHDSFLQEVLGANETATRADQNLPEPAADRLNLSYSSDTDLLMAESLSLSSSPSFIESSSPYLRSLSINIPNTSCYAQSSSTCFTANERPTEDEDIYNDSSLEMGLLELQLPPSAQRPPPSPPCSPSSRRATPPPWVPPSTVTPDASPVKPPKAQLSRAPTDVPHEILFDRNTGAAVPFVRPPFPQRVRDRSPVVGISTSVCLRTCFRIGEARNTCSTAFRTGQDVVIELYAKVLSSQRVPGNMKQSFIFGDIFSPGKPPYLRGVFRLWKGNDLWNADAKLFLDEAVDAKMARVLGRIVRDEKGPGLEMKILSIWEVGWEDLSICKGHVFSV